MLPVIQIPDKKGYSRCAFGWQGPLCDQCILYPGCKHGSCHNTPWQCNCDVNWGGILCDKEEFYSQFFITTIFWRSRKMSQRFDKAVNWCIGIKNKAYLNYCRHEPCQNGGLCQNIAPDKYECICTKGFLGINCQISHIPCSSNPCHNSGTCLDFHNSFMCNCAAGWTGNTCEMDINECVSAPCLHGGTCVDRVNGYQCLCPTGRQGTHCQLDSDECAGQPCMNAVTCQDLLGDYHCECQEGWTGKNCDTNINDCADQCQNSGVCVDLVSGYRCICAPGYIGRDCQIQVDECASNPCQNGGICIDLIPGYSCKCPDGLTGQNCQIDTDLCTPNPCQRRARCFIMEGDYFCLCPPGYDGKDCSQPKVIEVQEIDSCTVSIPTNNSGGVLLVSSGICGRHGLCISQPGGSYVCSCNMGYKGDYCHENVNDCRSNPCQNSGTCIDLINSYQCICSQGWEGTLCNINKNDCEPNPCRNWGRCIDLVAGFMCQCADGWKGKTCTLRESQCDPFTCANGGICIDLGETFTCHCPINRSGNTCQIPLVKACDSNPCQNNGTCVNSGDSFTCLCKEAFEGPLCQHNVNDCNPFPCFNGGTCIDGVNWYKCQCAKGFTGPDCRINIDECLLSPCTYGSTCIDGIGEYRCICPPGRSGVRCEEVLGQRASPMSCLFKQRLYKENITFEHDCNRCMCQNGVIKCSKIWCGPQNCAAHPNISVPAVTCGPHESCVVETEWTCITKPCLPWGQCKDLAQIKETQPKGLHTQCVPNSDHLSHHCTRITLVFDKSKMPAGVSVEALCDIIRQLSILQDVVREQTVYILCGLQTGRSESLHIMMSTDPSKVSKSSILQTAVDSLTQAFSRKLTNSSALAAVIQVRVDAALENDHTYEDFPCESGDWQDHISERPRKKDINVELHRSRSRNAGKPIVNADSYEEDEIV
ncbi:hypothetical protein CHS0354_004353 [Potamilus streckersoni]|uniref:EGF-like domain-containing protein n=1 Tax=Potamilus streckersoni TaxID=2493646 RepID=A0AAE0SGJ7_9BIVA|nr:hypothetical protein CHS0354_004353 [Potamilus streckersoni]